MTSASNIKQYRALLAFCASVVVLAFMVMIPVAIAATTTASSSAKTSKTAAPVSVPAAQSFTLQDIPASTGSPDFVVGPGKQEMTLNPGQSTIVDLTIANRTGVDKTFSIHEEDFVGSDNPEQTVVLLGDDRGPYSLKNYISIPAATVFIPNGKKIHVPITVTVPENAQPGGLYGSVVVAVTTSPGDQSSADNAAVPTNPLITRIGTLFFVRVPGPVTATGHLVDFSIAGNKSFFWQSQPVAFDITYKNEGSIYLDPSGTITITNIAGSPVETVNVDPWFAMPGSTRFREVSWNPPFLFGRYVAHAVINRGYASTTDEADLVFWVIPWKVILIVLVGLFVLIALVRWIARNFKIARK